MKDWSIMDPKYLDFFSKCHRRKLELSDFKLIYKATKDGDLYNKMRIKLIYKVTKDEDLYSKMLKNMREKKNLMYFVKSEFGRSFGGYSSINIGHSYHN